VQVGDDVGAGRSSEETVMLVQIFEFGLAVVASLIEQNLRFIRLQRLEITEAPGVALNSTAVNDHIFILT